MVVAVVEVGTGIDRSGYTPRFDNRSETLKFPLLRSRTTWIFPLGRGGRQSTKTKMGSRCEGDMYEFRSRAVYEK